MSEESAAQWREKTAELARIQEELAVLDNSVTPERATGEERAEDAEVNQELAGKTSNRYR